MFRRPSLLSSSHSKDGQPRGLQRVGREAEIHISPIGGGGGGGALRGTSQTITAIADGMHRSGAQLLDEPN